MIANKVNSDSSSPRRQRMTYQIRIAILAES